MLRATTFHAFFLFAHSLIVAAQAQSCRPGFEWASNTLGQDPCAVVNQVKSLCASQAPESNTLFSPPVAGSQNPCTCSGLYYSLVAGCSYCANGGLITWSTWSAGCTATSINNFGDNIDLRQLLQQVTLPQWVTDNVVQFVSQNAFDPGIASAYDRPEQPTNDPPPSSSPTDNTLTVQSTVDSTTATATAAETGTSSIPTITTDISGSIRLLTSVPGAITSAGVVRYTTTSDGTAVVVISTLGAATNNTSTQTSTTGANGPGAQDPSGGNGNADSSQPARSKGLNLGAIIGGVIGGLAFLILLIAVVVLLLRRRRRLRTAPSAAFMKEYGEEGPRMVTPRPFSPRPRVPGSRSGTPTNAYSLVLGSSQEEIVYEKQASSTDATPNDQSRTQAPLVVRSST